jgi:hypothetical protein
LRRHAAKTNALGRKSVGGDRRMSTRILEINGIEGILQGTQFYGGKKNGLSLQLTAIGGPKDPLRPINSRYVQLTKSQVQQLVRELQNWLGETELPWDKATQEHYEELEAELGRLRLQIHNLYAYSKRHTDS